MWKLNSSRLLSVALILMSTVLEAQSVCSISVKGNIVDAGTHKNLEFANIYITETGGGTTTDLDGYFIIENLCPGNYHFRISHISCETELVFIQITKDTVLDIHLLHHAELLDEVVVHGHNEAHRTQTTTTIHQNEILKSGEQLANLLENISGVSSLKTGTGISKPMIHGLYGNRISVLNNGILQSGQQWGNDHAPEIDPFMADHLSVIKGASALAYGGSSLGGVVLVDVDNIKQDPHFHGSINSIYHTNGRGTILNGRAEKYAENIAFRIKGSLRNSGDQQTPGYYLRNTGRQERNFSIQLENHASSKWKNSIYYSYFNTTLGILRGAHISSLSDLKDAFARAVPFYTESEFQKDISSPKQAVIHQLLKLESDYILNDNQALKISYGGQLNDRSEFDIRRAGRSDIAALHLKQWSHSLQGDFKWSIEEGKLLKVGGQFVHSDNTNDPLTGILPLIPDYLSNISSVYTIYQKESDDWLFEIGGRYDLRYLLALAISSTAPREVIRHKNYYSNISLSTGAKYKWSKHNKTNMDIGYVQRAPEVNELYSNGLHQGVSGIEQGNPDLNSENSIKLILNHQMNLNSKFFLDASIYSQWIGDYIFLKPRLEPLLTIRGAFPVYDYIQTDAWYRGMDLLMSFESSSSLKWIAKYQYITATEQQSGNPIIYTPPSSASLQCQFAWKDFGSFHSNQLNLNLNHNFQADENLNGQDLLDVPESYSLLNASIETGIRINKNELKISLTVDNLFNTSYRNYLNRQRYFADELGRNFKLRLNYSF